MDEKTDGKNLVHKSVLLEESIHLLNLSPGKKIIDATFGGGGHSRSILEAIGPGGKLLAIDWDRENLEKMSGSFGKYGESFVPVWGNFSHVAKLASATNFPIPVDGILLDLGFSSLQMDDRTRGFSFQSDSKLDMRGDRTRPLSAWDVVNFYKVDELSRIFRSFGEERKAFVIAKAIVEYRKEKPIDTALELSALVERTVGGRKGSRIHPATRIFQAIRIEVNGELDNLERVLEASIDLLAVGGRLVVISFHSLEDRIVKNFFKKHSVSCVCPPRFPICRCGQRKNLEIITKKPVVPTGEEVDINRRSRSAKLRAAERI
ncbi:MAG: 16S rRNA (cytosine1402-N4)-methyltransferase [Parcubacteria group bacterium Gr01-1014_18]|nr:MAG: 16S rRNA (cytosine1402-N4)-methyltransferase [Parcubacteria group bacterium Greene0416_36]TSC81574.1 MAG: 16S rRNA (cytosine1402-N4)-methyltransferase [Parcubacteria group bacterium Gr01-1014_18]TSC99615.1 MAG: 16S rRNA (cytosine1402-N4)-methyltransferase [Parcubacteria group bacterium Greene1014_20]TSD07066.1 MAG: 16S rRNA (cytosine1402-N4)-methyltransferase [Parcubacteria group bacterium Greene0714_2]